MRRFTRRSSRGLCRAGGAKSIARSLVLPAVQDRRRTPVPGLRSAAEFLVLDAALPTNIFEREPIPYEAAFLAGKAYLAYRRRGGTRRSPLPDFFIGAHAAVSSYQLLTRDPARYRAYFHKLSLIAPD